MSECPSISMTTRSAISQAPDVAAQAHFGRSQPLGEPLLVSVQGGLERLRVERVGPHHQSVLAVVAVVAAAHAHLLEGVLAIQVLGSGIGRAYLEGHPAR